MMIHSSWKIKSAENPNINFALSNPLRYYQDRLTKIGFIGKNTKLLDAGCGAGHWSMAASSLNQEVKGIDATEKYLEVAKEIKKKLDLPAGKAGIRNLKFEIGKLENLPYPDESFDFIVCYNAWMYTHRRKSLREMDRVLKPGGKIYLGSIAGLGWYLKMIWQGIKISDKNLIYESLKAIKRKIPTSPKEAKKLLKNQGFRLLEFGADAAIGNPKIKIKPQYQGKFLGFWEVYEILAEKME